MVREGRGEGGRREGEGEREGGGGGKRESKGRSESVRGGERKGERERRG